MQMGVSYSKLSGLAGVPRAHGAGHAMTKESIGTRSQSLRPWALAYTPLGSIHQQINAQDGAVLICHQEKAGEVQRGSLCGKMEDLGERGGAR